MTTGVLSTPCARPESIADLRVPHGDRGARMSSFLMMHYWHVELDTERVVDARQTLVAIEHPNG
jgi:hypothetical protein